MFIVISVIKQLQAVRELEAAKEGNTDTKSEENAD